MSRDTIQDGFVDTVAGRVHYLHGGSGPALVLLHSNGNSAYEFETVLGTLAEHFHVYAWDMPGQGDSDPLTRHGSVEFYSTALISFLDAVGIVKASILGSSIGGAVGAEVAACYAGRVEKLIIAETLLRTASDWAKGWERVEQMFAQAIQNFDEVAPRFRNFTPDMLSRWNVDRSKAGGKTMVDVMWAIRDHDLASVLPRITVPTLIMFGEKGPANGYRSAFSEAMPEAEHIVLKDCGHFPMLDDPTAFVQAVLRFVSTKSI